MAKADGFETGHHDRVTVLHANFNGTRILTGSVDHRIKVWTRDTKTGARTLLDTFTAHDSDVRDAKFLHPTTGSHIGTIGNDLKFHLWTEDVSQAPQSGRRFRRVATIPSTPRVPFVSLDFKAVDNVYTVLALVDRQGLLSVYEPTSPDDLKDWTLVDLFNVCGSTPPGRGDETSFRVRWDQNTTPLAYMNSLTDDREQLSLVVAALHDVKIYRSVVPSADAGAGRLARDGASHRLMFYEAVKLPAHPALVRDVQWAPFNVRGTDRLATACRDGSVRVFELALVENAGGSGAAHAPPLAGASVGDHATMPPRHRSNPPSSQRHQQSVLTSAITGRAQSPAFNATVLPVSKTSPAARTGYVFPFVTTLHESTVLPGAHVDAWSLSFDGQGQLLMSSGTEGVTKIWRKSVLDGKWLMFAGQDIVDSGDDSDGDDDDAHGLGADSDS